VRIKFHPKEEDTYVGGSMEGQIFKCSALQNMGSHSEYNSHLSVVQSISYNLFLPKIFLSCSSDWTVHVWEDRRRSVFSCIGIKHF